MPRAFLIVFGLDTLIGALAYAMLGELLAGGGVVAGGLFVLLALAAAAGVAVLARAAYLDGLAARQRVAEVRNLRRRL